MVQRNTAVALGKLRDRLAIEPLTAALEDQDHVVHQNAKEVLKQLTGNRIKSQSK